ncbi:MAG: response regulator transcription factor [Chloroflexi bacterium]|nr:response regulator transcription factor [Chloroflexota bacterium]
MAGALLITADTSLGSLVKSAMSGSGVDVAVAKDTDAATRALVTMRVDAVIADALWPEDVTEARRIIASTGRDVPLAVIAGEATRWNRWRLPRGAVQVFRRPLDLREVRQALQLLVRGSGGTRELQLPGGVVLDSGTDTITRGEHSAVLTGREVQVLSTLASAQGAVVPTDEMLHRVWATETRNTDALRTHIRAIRAKLASIGAPDIIQNLPRRGYRLRTDAPAG